MPFNEHPGLAATRAAVGLIIAAALSSCGGGTYQVNAFQPGRILTFGDESNMLIGSQGLKYSINGTNPSTGVIDCSQLPLWNQTLAYSYAMVYQNCNSQAVAQPTALDFATLNAQVDDVQNQVAAFTAGDQFNGNDLVTIWAGTHDILADYQLNGSTDDVGALTADMKAKGAELAGIVNQIAGAGGKVILLTVPDMGLSPYAATENQRGDFDRAGLLSAMSAAFNTALRATVVNDGSKVGIVLPDEYVQSAVRNPRGYGFISNPNVTAGCLALDPLPTCTQDTLVTDPGLNSNSQSIYLWADATHLGAAAHAAIGSQASQRAHSNPF